MLIVEMVACSRHAALLHPHYSCKTKEFNMKIEQICQPGSDDDVCVSVCALASARSGLLSLHFDGYPLAAEQEAH